MKKILLALTLLTSTIGFANEGPLLDSLTMTLESENCKVTINEVGEISMEKSNGYIANFTGQVTKNTQNIFTTKLKTSIAHHENGEGFIKSVINELSAQTVKMEGKIKRSPKGFIATVISKVDGTITTTSCNSLLEI